MGTGFYLGCVRTPAGAHTFTRRHQLERFLCAPRWAGYWCATYNLEYDLMSVFGPRKMLSMDLVWSGDTRIVSASVQVGDTEKERLTFFDVSAFLPQGLRKLAKLVSSEKLEIPMVAGDRAVTPRKREYCARDTEITLKLAHFLQDGFMKLGAQLRLTAASTALDLFRRQFLHERLPVIDDRLRDTVYLGYHGGRVECFRLGEFAGPVFSNDFKGMYSSCMADLNLPSLASLNHTSKLDLTGEGMAKVDLEVPEHLWAGPVPVKEEKLTFPVGRIRGWVPLNEIRNALNAGCRIQKVHSAIQSVKTYPYLREYALKLNEVRETTKEEAVSTVAKLASNSLYGKFASRTGRFEHMPREEWVRRLDRGTLGRYDASRTIELPEFDAVRVCRSQEYPVYSNVIWSAIITSAARCKLYSHLEEDTTIYCDTDSVIGYRQYGTGTRIGTLVCKDVYDRLVVRGNKHYAGKLPGKGNDWDAHAKGVPRDQAREAVLHPEKVIWFRRPVKFLTALRGRGGYRPNQWIEVPKTNRAVYDKRALIGQGQQTVPLKVAMW